MTQEEVIGRVVDALVRRGLPYMIAGSFASNRHGVPRMTQDADIVVDIDEATAVALVLELEAEFYASEDAARDAVRLRRIFNLIHLDTGFKIDIVVRKPRPFSVEELRRRQPGSLAGRTVAFASAEDTVLAKLEWALLGDSERQYQDAVAILQVQGERLDREYLERWAPTIGVAEVLARAVRGERFH